MSDRPRFRREDPERTAPIRDWSKMFRAAGSWNATARNSAADGSGVGSWTNGEPRSQAPADGPGRGYDPGDPIAFGVETAYSVIEEHLREGQRAAERIIPRPTGDSKAASGAAPYDAVQDLVEQGMRLYSSLAPLWADFLKTMGSAGAAPDFARAVGAAVGAAPRNSGAKSIPCEIASRRPARVTLDLHDGADLAALATHGLRALESEKPVLTEVAFVTEGAGGPPLLRIRIPDAQPPGLYTGVIVDRRSGETRGTLSVRLGE